MWIFKGDFPFLHFLFCQNFENSHTKSGLVRSETLFWIINKICCFLKKGGMSKHQNGICRHTFFKKGSQVPFFGTLDYLGPRLVKCNYLLVDALKCNFPDILPLKCHFFRAAARRLSVITC